jgi:hypothetical protein
LAMPFPAMVIGTKALGTASATSTYPRPTA